MKYALLLIIIGANFLFTNINTSIAYEKISSDQILKIINSKRIENGSSPLSVNNKLIIASNNKAKYLIENKTFEHNSKNKKFSDWAKESGYEYSFIGENLAENFKTSDAVIEAWLKSESHKENLLNKNFTETGISVAELDGRIVVVQIFGRPRTYSLPLEKTIKNHISENMIKIDEKLEIQIISNLS